MALAPPARHLSEAGKRRLLAKACEPLFEPSLLQREIPFQLDLREGRAFVSIVAFTLLRMRPRIGGRLGEWLFKPIASHEFLNVRTYVRHRGEPGIFFLAEWLSNPLSVRLGPRIFDLPYRLGYIRYTHLHEEVEMLGSVTVNEGQLRYRAAISASGFDPSEAESLTEFLLERYTAFTCQGRRCRLFRVWHELWPQTPIEIEVTNDDLMASTGRWWSSAQRLGANYSRGVDVWMGRPHRIAD